MTKNRNLWIYSFYRFIEIKNKTEIKKKIQDFLINKNVKGTILVANEGLNGSLCGSKAEVCLSLKFIRKLLNIRSLNNKINKVDFIPFNKLRIRLKKEIVSLGQKEVDIVKHKGTYINPKNWDNFIEKNNVSLIDVRNTYEISIGQFKNSINPNTNTFREFPKNFKKMNIKNNQKIAMYCTGGIRCEKASSFLKKNGFKKIYQLEGGILNYLEYKNKLKEKSKWNGECFVFDNRVTVNKFLDRGAYSQCYGCRSPLTENDKKLKEYKKGVSCHNCFYKRTKKQFQRSNSRQKQMHSK